MNKMNVVFEKFANDKNLLDEFLKKSTLEEMYDFCLSIDKSISKAEFDEYISEAIDSYESYVERSVSDSELEEVTGGVVNPNKKLMGFIYSVYNNSKKRALQTASPAGKIMPLDLKTGMQTMPDGTMQSLK